MKKNFSHIIKKWFSNFYGGSLILPDGWYGRPYDNQHMLTSIIENEKYLKIFLDDLIEMKFEELKNVREEEGKLIFSNYKQLVFCWKSASSDSQGGTTTYNDGEVTIVTGSIEAKSQ